MAMGPLGLGVLPAAQATAQSVLERTRSLLKGERQTYPPTPLDGYAPRFLGGHQTFGGEAGEGPGRRHPFLGVHQAFAHAVGENQGFGGLGPGAEGPGIGLHPLTGVHQAFAHAKAAAPAATWAFLCPLCLRPRCTSTIRCKLRGKAACSCEGSTAPASYQAIAGKPRVF